jgi:hypothetical protein
VDEMDRDGENEDGENEDGENEDGSNFQTGRGSIPHIYNDPT